MVKKTKTKTKRPEKEEKFPQPGVEPRTSYMQSHLLVYCATSPNVKRGYIIIIKL